MYHYRTAALIHVTPSPLVIRIAGWIENARHQAHISFIDLADGTATLQCLIKSSQDEDLFLRCKKLRPSFLVSFHGRVVERSSSGTGKLGHLEFMISEMQIIYIPSVTLDHKSHLQEHTRFEHRYLDLRNPKSSYPLLLRSKVIQKAHAFFAKHDFSYIETPILTSSTPEGARDFLVLNRHYPGCAYALAQSPQLYKQILMTGGIQRYYQIARCFRDEDLRANRQPEFTQIDLEIAWDSPQKLMSLINEFILDIITYATGQKISHIDTITYQASIQKYGTDSPDLSIDDSLNLQHHRFGVSICSPAVSELDDYLTLVPHIAVFVVDAHEHSEKEKFLIDVHQAKQGDVIFCSSQIEGMDKLRSKLAHELGMVKPGLYPVWVVDFPMFQRDEEDHLVPAHHPFTEFVKTQESPHLWKSAAYDLVINGQELGSGSVRITDPDKLLEVFNIIGYEQAYIEKHFKFFLKALSAGTPPSCGIGLGLERIIMVLLGEDNIRNVSAFPKSQSGHCFLTHTPLPVTQDQLESLGVKLSVSPDDEKIL